jgi:hypothetical protein
MCVCMGLGFELRAFWLLSRHSTIWLIPPALNYLFIFIIVVLGVHCDIYKF